MSIALKLMYFACAILLVSTAWSSDDNLPDSIMISKITGVKGGQFNVAIDFVNDQDLAAVTIPVALKGDGATIDSISFEGSRVAYINVRPITISKDRKQVVFGAICMTEDYIAPGRGLLATLYVSTDKQSKSEAIVVDTATIHPATLLFTKSNSASFVPQTVSGSITFGESAAKESTEPKKN